jgi:dTDP-4-amino-4,6-dideoxygalactose transaminase
MTQGYDHGHEPIGQPPILAIARLGDGGFLVTNDDDVAAKVRLYRNHGLKDRDTCLFYGVNSRLDSPNAEVLMFRLGRLDGVLARRRRNVDLYRARIKAKEVYLPPCQPHEKHAYVMMIAQAERRDRLQAYLEERGIQTLVYYGTPLHLHPAAAKLGYKRGDFPVAEAQAARVLALPHHQHLTEEQIAFVADSINAFYAA